MKTNVLKNILAALSIAALGAVTSAGAGEASDTRSVTVTAKEFEFQPAMINAEPGQTLRIELVNEGRISHNLHFVGNDVKTETIQAGNSDTITLTVPDKGEIRFRCEVPGHKQSGMVGKIVTTR